MVQIAPSTAPAPTHTSAPTNTSVAAIAARSITKTYSVGNQRLTVLDNVDFHADPGQCVFLVGPSGSGKSTLLSILGCLLGCDSGELVSPSDARPMVRMVDDRRLRVLAEVDEYDAMRLSIGLPADVYSDASRDPIATGTVSRIEPLMTRKSRYGEWAGEQVDTHVRRIWIDLSNPPELPINLPVEVSVYSGATDSPSSFNANVGKRDDANAS